MLNIFYGRESTDKERFIYENIHDRALIIVPDQFTLEAEQQAFRYLHTKGLMDVEVLSMSRLGSRLISELGGGKQTFIDKYGRHMILASAARRERENLKVFRGLEGKNSFIEMVNDFISEMKQYNCGTRELEEMAASAEEGSYTQKKLEDLALLFSRYEEEIEGKYTDSEDYIDLYLSKISKSELIKGNHVWIYGFDSFAPKALKVVGQLIARADTVNVVLTWDTGCRDEELFQLTGLVMDNLEFQAKAVGAASRRIKIEEARRKDSGAAPDRSAAAKSPAIRHLERELYAVPSLKSDDADGITLVEAAGIYNEAESAAAFVLHLVRDEGLRYRDIRLVCNDQETRGPVIKRIFQEYGIELFSDTSRDIMSSPVVQYVISLFDVVTGKYRSDDIFHALKSGFGDLSAEDVTMLENYAVKYRIRHSMWKNPFTKGEEEYGEEGLAGLESLRQQAVKHFIALEELMKEEGSTADFIYDLYRFLYDEVQLPDRILSFIDRQEKLGRADLAGETGQIWGKVIGILDQMIEIMGNEPFDTEVFFSIFKAGLSQVEIGVLPPTRDGLMMGTMERTRLSDIRALIVIGANEGVLPQEKPAQGLFSSEEKELFKEKGTELCKVDAVVLMEERLAIYRNLSKPRDYLWMSYSQSDEEGKENRPSSVFLKIKELFPALQVQKDVLNADDPTPLIVNSVSGIRHLTEEIQHVADGDSMDPQWEEVLKWYRKNDAARLDPIIEGLNFTNLQEDLGAAAARALFLRRPEDAISLSPSRLEKFSRCPFSHFVAYGLKPDERRVFEIAPREIGDIYHECLMTLTRTLSREDLDVTDPASPWMTITREQCSALVRDTAERQMEQYREGLFHLGNEEKYRSERIYDICDKVCWAVVEQVRAGRIERNVFEANFGRGAEIQPIEVDAGGETVYIEGKIDRVDYMPGDRVKIIDYKTGNEQFSVDEARAGYRLQLMLYLTAACEGGRKPAGVFYFHISEPMLNAAGSTAGEDPASEPDRDWIERETQKNFRLNGIMVDDPEVIESIAGNFEGYSNIVPLRAGKEKISGTGPDILLSEEDFQKLQRDVSDKVAEICQKLIEGSIDIHPMKTKTRSACTFCEYHGICRFDTVFEGCSYEII